MEELRRLVVVSAALICIASGCAKLLGIESHSLADGGGAGAGGAAGTLSGSAGSVGGAAGGSSGSDAGYVSDGEATSATGCGVDGAVAQAGGADAGAACGFSMPNPASSGLSDNLAHYTPTAEGIRDDITQLEWQDTVNANSKIKQGEAIQYCNDLGSGWRLPTRLELASLVDWTRTGPTIDPMFAGTPAQWFWTSSIFACNPSSAYYVGFDKGSTHPISPDTQNFYRCVRGGPARCVQTRYVLVDAGKSVHDAVTGLTWQRDTAPKKNWSDAKSTCLNLGGGWRLPSPGELQTLVDETKGGQDMDGKDVAPLDRDMFPNTPAAYFWASAPLAGDSSRAWYVAFIHGHADVDMVANLNYFRCVRWDGTQTP